AINGVAAPILVAVPLLHRFSPVAAPLFLVFIAYAFIFVVNSMLGTGAGTYLYFFTFTALGILFIGPEHVFLTVALGVVAAGLIIILNIIVPHDKGIVSPAALFFGHFVTSVIASSAILYGIIFYAVRQFARAEEAAEREHQRSEGLLVNILPPSVAERLKDRVDSEIADAFSEASILLAGVVGTRKFFYDVWGDAVNIASRMESTSEVGKIQVAPQTYELIAAHFELQERGMIEVRGKGLMQTWFLVGRKPVEFEHGES